MLSSRTLVVARIQKVDTWKIWEPIIEGPSWFLLFGIFLEVSVGKTSGPTPVIRTAPFQKLHHILF